MANVVIYVRFTAAEFLAIRDTIRPFYRRFNSRADMSVRRSADNTKAVVKFSAPPAILIQLGLRNYPHTSWENRAQVYALVHSEAWTTP